MSATLSGAIKAYLETQGLGCPFYRDLAPQDQPLPLGIVQEGISYTPVRTGDGGAPDAVDEQVQVAVYQAKYGADGKVVESPTLATDVMNHLARYTQPVTGTSMPPKHVHWVRVDSMVRLPRIDQPGSTGDASDRANIVSNVVTITVRRSA